MPKRIQSQLGLNDKFLALFANHQDLMSNLLVSSLEQRKQIKNLEWRVHELEVEVGKLVSEPDVPITKDENARNIRADTLEERRLMGEKQEF